MSSDMSYFEVQMERLGEKVEDEHLREKSLELKAQAESVIARAQSVVALRAEKGRAMSPAMREQLTWMLEGFEQLAEVFRLEER